MAENCYLGMCKEERKNGSFFKVLQGADKSSENMRALPLEFVRSLTKDELSGKMKIKEKWGSSWELGISKNPRFYFMEKSGWEKFLTDNYLGDSETLTFTHKGRMRFKVNIYNQNGTEMVQPRQSLPPSNGTGRIKTEQREGVSNVVKKEEVVVPSDLSDLGPIRARSNGAGSHKRKLSFGPTRAEESISSKRAKNPVNVGRDTAGASSSSPAEFTITIKNSYIIQLAIPKSAGERYMPNANMTFKIHHPDRMSSSDVVYLARKKGQNYLSCGWRQVVDECNIGVGDRCKFTLIKHNELLLHVFKPWERETQYC